LTEASRKTSLMLCDGTAFPGTSPINVVFAAFTRVRSQPRRQDSSGLLDGS